MNNVQMLVPMEPNAFWEQLRTIVTEVVAEGKRLPPVDNHIDRPLLKATEVCDILKVSKPTLYDWLKHGKIKSVKIQSRRYFHWNDVEELISASKVNLLNDRP